MHESPMKKGKYRSGVGGGKEKRWERIRSLRIDFFGELPFWIAGALSNELCALTHRGGGGGSRKGQEAKEGVTGLFLLGKTHVSLMMQKSKKPHC